MKITFDTTLERDMDLLIIEEFISDPAFAQIFLDAIGISETYTVDHAVHSKTDADLGESDIVLVLNINGYRHAIHIEDKIDAPAMEAQHERYHKRAQKDISRCLYENYSVLIVAPEKYLSANKEANKYENQVTYEQLRNYFASKADIRSRYKLALIDRAIDEQKNGYQWEANPGVVRFCTSMAAYQKTHYPNLPIASQAWWPEFKTLLPGVKLIYKANKGHCDLQFSNCTPQELYIKVHKSLSTRMLIEKAGKSSSVRICVAPVWFENRFEDNIVQVDEALNALEELYALSNHLIME